MSIRNAKESDLVAIVAIYNASVPTRIATADTELISVESRLNWFYDHSPSTLPIWVIERDNKIVGWISFQAFNPRPAYYRTAELSIYISPEYHRQGIGKKLLEQAIVKSPSLGINNLVGLIFAHNKPSLKLFSQYKFEKWGHLPHVAELDGFERDLIIVGRRVK